MVDPTKNYSLWLTELEKMTFDEQLVELDRIKMLVKDDPPHHFVVYGGICKVFEPRITRRMHAHFPPPKSNDLYTNFFMFHDSHRATIFLNEHSVRICGGAFGRWDGVSNETYEIEVFSRRDRRGVLAEGAQSCFVDNNGQSVFHGKASDLNTWESCETLKELKRAGVDEIVKIFCEMQKNYENHRDHRVQILKL